jgi:putative FmdB family regulatory protein
MPFYEYECQNCKFYTELMQKISDPPLEKCPSCGKKAMQKLISAPVFRLKGSGWYETDFKGDSENKRNLAGADKEESKSEESATSKADDVKADAKSDAKPAAAETKSTPAEAKTTKTPARAAVAAAKGGHKKSASRPAARSASRAPAKAKGKAKAKAKGKAGKGRR